MERLGARPVLWRTKLPPSLSKAGIQLLAPRAADRVSAFPTELSTVVMQERVAGAVDVYRASAAECHSAAKFRASYLEHAPAV
jgi:hypothetical protein